MVDLYHLVLFRGSSGRLQAPNGVRDEDTRLRSLSCPTSSSIVLGLSKHDESWDPNCYKAMLCRVIDECNDFHCELHPCGRFELTVNTS